MSQQKLKTVSSQSLNVPTKTQNVFSKKGYKAEEKLAAGAFGEVYRGLKVDSSQTVAIKVMDLAKMTQRVKDDFLPREINALARIRHENVVEVYDIFRADDKLYIFMEFANQGDIKDWIKKNGALQESVAKYWFRQVCYALNYMHTELCMVHRDIKVDNVLLHKHKAKLSDFGFARIINFIDGKPELSQTYCGTPTYYSPQLLERKPYNGFAADNWAMGVMLFMMMNNKFPYSYGDNKVTRRQMNDTAHIPARYVKEFPDLYKEFQESFLIVDEDSRTTMPQALQHPWLQPSKKN